MITAFYTGLLGLFYIFISMIVIKGRIQHLISLGSGKNNEILHLTSAHNNFSNYTVFFLFSTYLLEVNNSSRFLLHTLLFLFTFGRVIHFYAIAKRLKKFTLRRFGMILTYLSMIVSFSILIIENLK